MKPTLRTRFAEIWDNGGMVILLAALIAYAVAMVPNFATGTNLIYSLGLSLTTTGIVACGMLFCLASGDFDLSVGAVAAFAGMLVAVLMNQMGGSMLAIPLALGACALIGAFNGLVIAGAGINALIATLATMQIVRGGAFLLNDGNSLGIASEAFAQFGTGHFFGLPIPIWVFVGCVGLFGFLLHMTVFGRNALAIGGNREAARLAGIPVLRTKVAIFALQAALAGLAGIVSTAQQQLGDPRGMMGLELRVISACVLGGVALTGGVASIHHVVIGVLIMGTVQNIMDLTSVPTFYQYLVSGAILLAAVLLDRLKRPRTA
jgi:L-arabinose transport system permease protein